MLVEGRGLSWKETQEATKTEGLVMNLTTPESVQKLQTALHDKAKESPNFRFYALYDKVYRKDVLAFAYECGKANGGSRSGRPNLRGRRVVRKRAMVGRTGAKAEKPNLSTTPGTAGIHTQAGRETAAARGARYPRQDSGNGSSFGNRTHLRGRSATRTVCLSARSQRTGRGKTRPQADQHWPWRNRRCGSQQLL